MKGLKIKCWNCSRICFETTNRYDPEKVPNGSMVRSLVPYKIDWLTCSTTLPAEMTCPECLAPLVVKGKISIVLPPQDTLPVIEEAEPEAKPEEKATEELPGIPAFACDVCGREFKSKNALKGHGKAHRNGRSQEEENIGTGA